MAGRFADAEGVRVRFAPDLDENLVTSDEVARGFIAKVELIIRENGIEAPAEDEDLFFEPRIARELDLIRAGVSTVLWAVGYVHDFDWIHHNVVDEYGYPIQQQGVTDLPGLYFMGLHWMYKRKSGLIFGVGEDGQHVVEHIEQTARI